MESYTDPTSPLSQSDSILSPLSSTHVPDEEPAPPFPLSSSPYQLPSTTVNANIPSTSTQPLYPKKRALSIISTDDPPSNVKKGNLAADITDKDNSLAMSSLLNNRYPPSSQGPFVIFLQSDDQKLLHPLTIDLVTLCSNAKVQKDVGSARKMPMKTAQSVPELVCRRLVPTAKKHIRALAAAKNVPIVEARDIFNQQSNTQQGWWWSGCPYRRGQWSGAMPYLMQGQRRTRMRRAAGIWDFSIRARTQQGQPSSRKIEQCEYQLNVAESSGRMRLQLVIRDKWTTTTTTQTYHCHSNASKMYREMLLKHFLYEEMVAYAEKLQLAEETSDSRPD